MKYLTCNFFIRFTALFLLSFTSALPQGQFKPERGSLLTYELKENGQSYKLLVEVKTYMPYRSFSYKKIGKDTVKGEVDITIFSVKGADKLIFDFQGGQKILNGDMSLWLSRWSYRSLIKENKITLAVEDTIPVLFTITGKAKEEIKLNGKKRKINTLVLSETDTVSSDKVKGGRVIKVAEDEANPIILFYKGRMEFRLNEVIGVQTAN